MTILVTQSSNPGIAGSLYGITKGNLDDLNEQLADLKVVAEGNPLDHFIVLKLEQYPRPVMQELIKGSWPSNVYFNSWYF